MHFLIEDQTLLPLLAGRMLAEHRQLHAMLDGLQRNDVGTLERFAKCLVADVHFEERELFPSRGNRMGGD